ncbi:6623_t:CDS:2 [Ambispora leptoticha]|uniref:6623_t:CDS:1 n=1 Tax=Ambispora leptoticha TaxID=144679 RepID=A0A9N9FJ71_9GLOM|nr:6623_t:CDS:2 [Ambispora leptoticha]
MPIVNNNSAEANIFNISTMSNINKIDNNGNNSNNDPIKDERLPLDKIDVPFPLTDQLTAIIASYKERTISGKPPNGFILYRKALVRELNAHGYYLPAKDISPLASEKWKNKPEIVKEEYRQISSNIGKIFQKSEQPVILTPENFCAQSTIKTIRKNVRSEAATSNFIKNKFVSKIDTSIPTELFDGSQKSDSEPNYMFTSQFEHIPEYNLSSVKQRTIHDETCIDNFDYLRNGDVTLGTASILEPITNYFLESYNSYSLPINESSADHLLSLMDRESEVYFEKSNFPVSNWTALVPEIETECFNNYLNTCTDNFIPLI